MVKSINLALRWQIRMIFFEFLISLSNIISSDRKVSNITIVKTLSQRKQEQEIIHNASSIGMADDIQRHDSTEGPNNLWTLWQSITRCASRLSPDCRWSRSPIMWRIWRKTKFRRLWVRPASGHLYRSMWSMSMCLARGGWRSTCALRFDWWLIMLLLNISINCWNIVFLWKLHFIVFLRLKPAAKQIFYHLMDTIKYSKFWQKPNRVTIAAVSAIFCCHFSRRSAR